MYMIELQQTLELEVLIRTRLARLVLISILNESSDLHKAS